MSIKANAKFTLPDVVRVTVGLLRHDDGSTEITKLVPDLLGRGNDEPHATLLGKPKPGTDEHWLHFTAGRGTPRYFQGDILSFRLDAVSERIEQWEKASAIPFLSEKMQPVDVEELVVGEWVVSGFLEKPVRRWIRLGARHPSFELTLGTMLAVALHISRTGRSPRFLRSYAPPRVARLIAVRRDGGGTWERRALVYFPNGYGVPPAHEGEEPLQLGGPGWYWHSMEVEASASMEQIIDRDAIVDGMTRFESYLAMYPRVIEYSDSIGALETLPETDQKHVTALATYYVPELLQMALEETLDRAEATTQARP